MALPKIDVPVFEVKILSQKEPIKFRPFTVKEEKLFLIAKEAKDEKTVFNTILQVLNNCLLDKLDVNTLPLFDVETLFIHLRARSQGEMVELDYRCANDVSDGKEGTKKCNNLVHFDLNLMDIVPQKHEKHSDVIKLTDTIGIKMNYPNIKTVSQLADDLDDDAKLFNLVVSSIDYIYDKDNIHYAKDTDRKELEEFVDNLRTSDLEKVKSFFDTMPKLEKDLDFKCKKCGLEEKIHLEGLQSFFQ